MADVALVGFPNAGKSTLISRISAAKPKIADYPFTTLEPNLGVVRLDDSFEMVVADIPGLIEGASEGRGLGHRFLRHVERARALVVLIDLAPAEGRAPEEQERVLLDELGRYQPDLLDRPRIVVGSRADVADADVQWQGPRMSAITGAGVRELVGEMAKLVHEAREAEPVNDGLVIHRPALEGVRIERERRRRVPGDRASRRASCRALRPHEPRSAGVRRSPVEATGRGQGARTRRGTCGRHGLGRRLQLRLRARPMSTVVAKVGTSSLTNRVGVIDVAAIEKLCDEVAQLRVDGHDVVVVSSGAVSAGVAALGLTERPTDCRRCRRSRPPGRAA